MHGHEIREINICPFPFYSFVINPDGEVTVCCNDWKRGNIVGNATTENICEIWNGKKYYEFLMGILKNGRFKNSKTCAVCEYPMYDAVDGLDGYTDILLNKFNARR